MMLKSRTTSGERQDFNALAQADRRFLEDTVGKTAVFQWNDKTGSIPEWPKTCFDEFYMQYFGETRQIHYSSSDGRPNVGELKNDDYLARLNTRLTHFFPNPLIDSLVEMHELERTPREIYEAFREGYISRGGGGPPNYEMARSAEFCILDSYNADEFPDVNLFFIMVSSSDFLRGMGMSRLMFNAALTYYDELGYEIGAFAALENSPNTPMKRIRRPADKEPPCNIKYGIGFTRMTSFQDATGIDIPASADETFEYFDQLRENDFRDDWSIRFHVKAGAKILCPLPRIATDYKGSRNAGTLAVYTPEALDNLRRHCDKQYGGVGRSPSF